MSPVLDMVRDYLALQAELSGKIRVDSLLVCSERCGIDALVHQH